MEVNHVEDHGVLQVDILVVEDLVAERFVRHVALLVDLEVLHVEQCLPQEVDLGVELNVLQIVLGLMF